MASASAPQPDQIGLYLDIADTYHDMVKPPNRYNIKEQFGRCELKPLVSEINKDKIINLKQVQDWLKSQPEYENILTNNQTLQDVDRIVLLKGSLDVTRHAFVRTHLGTHTDFENTILDWYDQNAIMHMKGIEVRNVRLANYSKEPLTLFPDHTSGIHYNFLMDAFKDQTFFEMYMTNDTRLENRCSYVSCIATKWDQARNNPGHKYQQGVRAMPVGITNNFVSFETGNSVTLKRDGINTESTKVMIREIDFDQITTSVKNLCNTSSDVLNSKILDQLKVRTIIRANLVKTDVAKKGARCSGKRTREEHEKPEPILDALTTFLYDESKPFPFLHNNLLNIKRSGDYGQIGAAKAFIQDKTRTYLTTFDKLCYLRAKHEGVPCVRIKEGVVDIYHGKIEDTTLLLNMLTSTLASINGTTLQYVESNTEDVAFANQSIVSQEDPFSSWCSNLTLYFSDNPLAQLLQSTHKTILESLQTLYNKHCEIIQEYNNYLKNLIQLKHPQQNSLETYISALQRVIDTLTAEMNSDATKIDDLKANGYIELRKAQDHLADLELYIMIAAFKKESLQFVNDTEPFKLNLIPVFDSNHMLFNDVPKVSVYASNDVLDYLGFDKVLRNGGVIKDCLSTKLPLLEQCIEMKSITRVELDADLQFILKKIYGYSLNLLTRSMKRGTDINNHLNVFQKLVNERIDSYSVYTDRLADIVDRAIKATDLFTVIFPGEPLRGGDYAQRLNPPYQRNLYLYNPDKGLEQKARDNSIPDDRVLYNDSFIEKMNTPHNSFYEARNIWFSDVEDYEFTGLSLAACYHYMTFNLSYDHVSLDKIHTTIIAIIKNTQYTHYGLLVYRLVDFYANMIIQTQQEQEPNKIESFVINFIDTLVSPVMMNPDGVAKASFNIKDVEPSCIIPYIRRLLLDDYLNKQFGSIYTYYGVEEQDNESPPSSHPSNPSFIPLFSRISGSGQSAGSANSFKTKSNVDNMDKGEVTRTSSLSPTRKAAYRYYESTPLVRKMLLKRTLRLSNVFKN